MSDLQKSIVSLTLLATSCDAAIPAIEASDGTVDDELRDLDHADLNAIHRDFLSLLSLIYTSTTKIALCLKPSKPVYSASIAPLNDLTKNVGNLSQNVRLITAKHGMTLLKEYKSVATGVIGPLAQLAKALLQNATSSGPPTSDESIVRRAAEVHHAIDKGRGLSASNHVAIRSIWKMDQASLGDAMNELNEMSTPDPNGYSDFDDGWDELGIEPSKEMTLTELERLKLMQPIVKLSVLLHKNVTKRVLSAPFETLPVQDHFNPLLDKLVEDSTMLSAAVDELVSTAYAPQDPIELSESLRRFTDVTETLSARLSSILLSPTVENLLKSISKETPAQKWFDTCFNQLDKSTEQLSKLLSDIH
ncbi:hypothetical protein FA15DRAFT_630677 [Coprinopsis marcescibilis]|uniref:Grap2 and cyclin-D-interacting-domain-containing protein n=1 Tax=Coprinopsis marcescibilis TaxID=230819 RepID=A0A5C3LDD9_COPMA|nr:hypothetical protein FA15DRAFT_630677 [Coprinopsis marcescibilis]